MLGRSMHTHPELSGPHQKKKKKKPQRKRQHLVYFKYSRGHTLTSSLAHTLLGCKAKKQRSSPGACRGSVRALWDGSTARGFAARLSAPDPPPAATAQPQSWGRAHPTCGYTMQILTKRPSRKSFSSIWMGYHRGSNRTAFNMRSALKSGTSVGFSEVLK